MNHQNHETFLLAFFDTLKGVLKDKGVALMLIIAPILYGFFYPWPYNSEVVQRVPVGIVDLDNSQLSNTIIRYASASPYLDSRVFLSEQSAKEAIWHDKISGYLIIPDGLEKKVTYGQPASVSVLGNGGYFLLNKNVQLGFSQVVGTVSAGIQIKKEVAHGEYFTTAKDNVQAVPLQIVPLFNTTEGYGAYVVPAVSMLILQQTLLIGTAILIATWYEQRRHHANVRGWLGRIFAISLIGFIMGCFYYGWVFSLQDYPSNQNLWGSLLFLALYFPTITTLGCIMGLWFQQRERSLQILIFSSLPLFFLTGYPWPVHQLPELLQWLRWLIPVTPGIHASLQLNQMGASLSQVSVYLYALLGLWLFYAVCLFLMEWFRYQKKQA